MRTRAENDDQRARMFGRVADLNESRVQRDVADFRRVGLKQTDAERAAMALQRGTYTSFRESALARATFGDSRVHSGILERVIAEREQAALSESGSAGSAAADASGAQQVSG